MPQLIRRAIAPFPEPTVIFDVEDRVVLFANPATKFILPDLDDEEVEGMKLDEFIRLSRMDWGDSILATLVAGQAHAHQYQEDIRAWIFGSKLSESFGDYSVGLLTCHARTSDEQAASLQHIRLRSIVELALYISDARQDNITALRMVQANYERLQRLEGSVVNMLEDLGTHLIS